MHTVHTFERLCCFDSFDHASLYITCRNDYVFIARYNRAVESTL